MTSLLDYGLLAPESPQGRVAIALPLSSLGHRFPTLWPEVEAD